MLAEFSRHARLPPNMRDRARMYACATDALVREVTPPATDTTRWFERVQTFRAIPRLESIQLFLACFLPKVKDSRLLTLRMKLQAESSHFKYSVSGIKTP